MAWQDLLIEDPHDLVEYIQLKDDPEIADTAKDAFRAIMHLYQKALMEKLIPICENWGYDRQIALEIGHQTFEQLWKYPGYDKKKAKQKDPKMAMLFYLFRIARRKLADYKKNDEGTGNPFTGDEEIVWEFPDIGSIETTPERKAILVDRYELIKKALSRLTNKHKIIYLTYKQYEEELNSGYKLPRELLKSLREELDLTQNSVRVYKNEAFKAVDDYLKLYGSK